MVLIDYNDRVSHIQKEGVQMPDTSKYYLEYRPADYWDHPSAQFANIKGELRRTILEEEFCAGTLSEVPQNLLADDLSDGLRESLGSLDPAWMGGEYLPSYEDGEIEIGRATLKSTLTDVISIRARRMMGGIKYRIVDEYESDFSVSPGSSALPLTLKELIGLVEAAELPSLRGEFDDRWAGEEEYIAFLRIYSPFYPQLEEWFREDAVEHLERHRGDHIGRNGNK